MGELVKRLVDNNREAILQRLPKYMTESSFFALLYNLDRKPKLAEAAQRNPNSLLQAIMKAADCGLLIGSGYGHCDLATFGDEVQLMVEYQGIIYQLVRAGAVLTVDAKCVYDGDDIRLGIDGIESWTPNLRDDRRRDWRWLNDKKNMLGAFATARIPLQARPGEFVRRDHWSPIGEIERAREISKMGKNPDGAWTQHYDAMAMKTAVRRLCKFITVCGPTDENKEAWERYGRTMEIDSSSYRRIPEENLQPDDDPGAKPRKSAPRRAAAGPAGSEHVTPPPQNDGERKKSSDAPSTPPPTKEAKPEQLEPPKAPPDEVISTERQYEILQQASAAGMKTMAFLKHVAEKFGVDLADLRSSQAAELSKFLKDMVLKSAE